ncbi:MAG: prepilin-type N-terminal cleavage/methylation domain-containing protein [Verrucomicrobiota bacterium]
MFIAPVKSGQRLGFTLLEIMLAVGILGMMSIAIYRFVESNLVAVRVSAEESTTDASYDGLANLLTEQLQNLPAGQGMLAGEAFKLSGQERDEMSWVCSSGAGLLTRYAAGDFFVTLRLRPMNKGDLMELGFVRKPKDDATPSSENETWVPLISNVESMQIRYFDPRLNTWTKQWTDTSVLPHLVRLSIKRTGRSVPWEAMLPLQRTPF